MKIGEGAGDLAEAASAALDRVTATGWEPGRRRPRAQASTCTAAFLSFDDLNAAEAASRTKLAIEEIAI